MINFGNGFNINEIINKEKYHPIITKKGKNWFKVMLIEDGFTFEDNLIETFFSLQGLDCVFNEDKFLMENSIEVPLNEFLVTLSSRKEVWLSQMDYSTGNQIFFAGDKRFSCKKDDKESLNKLIQVIRRKMEQKGETKSVIEQTIMQISGGSENE